MSAAHLYISVWFQIKFSEVEAEELRFGEQCVQYLMTFASANQFHVYTVDS